MKDVYEKTPQMGDPASLEPRITETLSNIERLKLEVQKYEVRGRPWGGAEWQPAWLSHRGVGDRDPAVSHHRLGCAGVISGNLRVQGAGLGALPWS